MIITETSDDGILFKGIFEDDSYTENTIFNEKGVITQDTILRDINTILDKYELLSAITHIRETLPQGCHVLKTTFPGKDIFRFSVDCEHATFRFMEDENDLYCLGLVIPMKSL